MAFFVGQRVECIDADPAPSLLGWEYGGAPTLGRIYTVTRVFVMGRVECLWLAELKRGPAAIAEQGPDLGYGSYRFRPVVERKTDISELVRIANEAARTGRVFA